MNNRHVIARLLRIAALCGGLVGLLGTSESLAAQDGSLLRGGAAGAAVPRTPQPAMGGAMDSRRSASNLASGTEGPQRVQPSTAAQAGSLVLQDTSWIYEPPQSSRVYRLNDIVTIRVDEMSRLTAEGNSESRRNTLYDAVLRDWIRLDGLDTIKPAPQSNGDPRVQGTSNQLYRSDASLESRKSMTFNIAARVVDMRPNGDLVLEARKSIVFNDNVWETSLSGICRPTDIAADNIVLSRDLLDLQIQSQERGRLYDNYKRGWLMRWIETLNPF